MSTIAEARSSSLFNQKELFFTQTSFPHRFGCFPSSQNMFHVFDHIDDAFFFFDKSYHVLYLNKTGSDILEKAYGVSIASGENLVEKLPDERKKGFTQMLSKVLNGVPVAYELEISSKKMWIHCKYFPSFEEGKKVNGFYGIVKDITAQKEVGRLEQKAESIEHDLFQSRFLFEQFMQNSPLVAWLTDARGTMHYMNPVYMKTYGFSEKDFGRSIYELFPAQVAVDYHINNQQVLKSAGAVEAVEKGVKANGQTQVLKIYKFPLLVNNERMIGGWAVDITDQVELQDKLIKSIERHEYVNEATSDAIYDWDFTTKTLYRSNRFEEIFGYPDKKISVLQRMRLVHPDDLHHFKHIIFSSLRSTAVNRWQVEYRLKIANGTYRNVLDKAFIIRGKDRALRVIGALQDITAQKGLQEQLVNQEKRSKREIIKSIIQTQEKERRKLSVELHDNVNQMLASCKLMLEVAKEDGDNAKMLTEKTYQSIQTVIDEIRRISHDLNPSAIVDVGLVEAIEQLTEKINVSGKIRVRFVPNSREYNTLNEDDKIAIFRMVQEQLSNILKHANASNIVIRLEVMSNKVRLCIKDDGVGFNLSQCKKGLGLHNIYNRVEYYSGSIQIHTSEGNGCEMCITLKLRNTLPAQLKIA